MLPAGPLLRMGRIGFNAQVEPPQNPAGPMTSMPTPSAFGQALAGAGGIQPPKVNVGVKFPVPPPAFPAQMPSPAAMQGLDLNNMANFRNIGPGLAHAQSPPTTYGFSSGNPGQLASNSNMLQSNAGLSLLEQALQQQMGGV